jgi:hypothetical protein
MLVCHRIILRVVAALGWWWLIIALAVGYAVLSVTDWFTNEKSLTVATWGLVLATLILFLDSFYKGREQRKRWERQDASRAKDQRERWEREDRLRGEDAKPKVAVELAQRDDAPEIVFRCYNLGSTIFFIDRTEVTFFDQPGTANRTSNITDAAGPPVLLPGKFISTTYDCTGFLTDGFREANIVFVLRGSHGLVSTEPVWFYVFRDGAAYEWRRGRLADRQPGTIVPQPRSIPEGQ